MILFALRIRGRKPTVCFCTFYILLVVSFNSMVVILIDPFLEINGVEKIELQVVILKKRESGIKTFDLVYLPYAK